MPVVVAPKLLRHAKCQMPLWPDGSRPQYREDGTPRLCYAVTEAGTSWCTACSRIVYQRVVDEPVQRVGQDSARAA